MADTTPRDWKELDPCITNKGTENYGNILFAQLVFMIKNSIAPMNL